jgi:hypothetical protein
MWASSLRITIQPSHVSAAVGAAHSYTILHYTTLHDIRLETAPKALACDGPSAPATFLSSAAMAPRKSRSLNPWSWPWCRACFCPLAVCGLTACMHQKTA